MTIKESLQDSLRMLDAYVSARGLVVQALDIIKAVESPDKVKPTAHLTKRESEIYKLLGEGLSMREIAARLGRSLKTVEAQRDTLRRKLGFPTSDALTEEARKHHA